MDRTHEKSKRQLEIDELPLQQLRSREGNHTSIGATATVSEDDPTESSHGPPSLNAIQVTQEYRVSGHMGNT